MSAITNVDQLVTKAQQICKWVEIMLDRADEKTIQFMKDCGKEAFSSGN